MAGGAGTMVGTLIGVLIMSTIKAGLPAMGLQQQWQVFITGFVVIGAVLLDIIRSKAARKVRLPDREEDKSGEDELSRQN
jgi:ribose transport system permease protein